MSCDHRTHQWMRSRLLLLLLLLLGHNVQEPVEPVEPVAGERTEVV